MATIDRIEVSGSVFTGPAPGRYHSADFDRPKQSIRFSLLVKLDVPYYYADGINNLAVAKLAATVAGAGFYGVTGHRLIDSEGSAA